MVSQNLYAALNTNVLSVVVQFENANGMSKDYTYKAFRSQGIQVGDWVVVKVANRTPQLCCAQVTKVESTAIFLQEGIKYNWIVSRIDTEQYNQALEKEMSFMQRVGQIEAEKRRQEIAADFASGLGMTGMLQLETEFGITLGPKAAPPAPSVMSDKPASWGATPPHPKPTL